ncbi:hypothetical protein G9A89_005761 [Geosiphon pyriformis]|nr:hypothetical protein G9A89_005761 [Geosiphon pyriformis]
MHSANLQAAVTNARDFEAAKLKANHTQAVNLVMNRSSELDSKLKQFKSVAPIILDQSTVAVRDAFPNSELPIQPSTISTDLLANNTTVNISTTHISTSSLSTIATSNIGDSGLPTNFQFIKSTIRITPVEFRNQNYLSLLVSPEDAAPRTQKTNQRTLTNNIPPTTISYDESLAAIFPFELKEPSVTSLFSGAILKEKPITAMYMDAKVDVDRAVSTCIITADRATKTPISEIDNLPIEINGIIMSIKVLVMEATQYQALVNNDWLSKTNAVLDWMTQELALSQNSRHMWVPAMCGHFKITNPTTPLIEFEEEKEKPT